MGLKHLIAATLFFLMATLFHASMQPARAGTCAVDNLPTTGTMTASRFNSRFTQVESCVNGNIGDANWDSSDPLSVTNVENNQSTFAVPFYFGINSTQTDVRPFRVPGNSTITGLTLVSADGSTQACNTGSASTDVSLVYEDSPTTVKTFTVTGEGGQTDFTLNKAVASTTDIDFDVTVNAGTPDCNVTVVVYLKTQHVQ